MPTADKTLKSPSYGPFWVAFQASRRLCFEPFFGLYLLGVLLTPIAILCQNGRHCGRPRFLRLRHEFADGL